MGPSPPIDALIRNARDRGVHLRVDGSRLRFRAPGGALPPDLKEQLAARRDEVIRGLREEGRAQVRVEPMAENQVGIWHAQLLDRSSAAYNIGLAIRVPGEIEARHVEEAAQVAVDRHEVLRTDYPDSDGTPVRRIRGAFDIQVEHITRDGPDADPSHLRSLLVRPFDLEGDPLFRVTRVSTGGGDVVLVAAHHLTLDGISLRLLAAELAGVASALARGDAPPPASAATGAYSEWVEGRMLWLRREEDEAASYWAGQLDPPPPAFTLPLDKPRTANTNRVGATVTRALDGPATESLRAICREHGQTPFVGMLAAWQLFLSRLTGTDDLVIGTPVHGRESVRFTRTIGHLVNVIPVRGDTAADPSLLEMMEQLRETLRGAMRFQDYPLPRITWDFAARTGRRDAPVQTFFALHDFSTFSALRSEGGGRLDEVPLDQLEGQFDLALDVYHEEGRYRCAWRYDATLFDASTIERWAELFACLVTDLCARPAVPGSGIALRSTGPASQLEGPSLPTPDPLLDTVLEQAEAQPDAVAVRGPDGDLTYRGLAESVESVAGAIGASGLGRGDRIAVLLERSRDIVPALLGVHGSGAAWVPLDPSMPSSRLDHMLQDSGARLLLTHRGLDADLGNEVPRLDLDAIGTTRGGLVRLDAAEPAYAIYTSGSTGRPKAVVVPSGALLNFLHSMRLRPGIDSSDATLAVTTFAFDISLLELLAPLLAGGRVVVASEEDVRDGHRLATRLDAEEITLLQATPATWRLLLASGWKGRAGMRALCGGERLPADLADELVAGVDALWNMYGPTETTVWSTIQPLHAGGPVRIGAPIHNTTTRVLDSLLRPLPVGFAGELCIGGAGVATGYLGRPDLTADRFVTPESAGGERLYRTGDRVRQRPGGTIEYLGRMDDQVKVRGFRIELGEVETVLRGHPDVADVAAAVRPGPDGSPVLAAWLVPGEVAPTVDAVRTWLATKLPTYMIPTAWSVVERLPLTVNGKLDRRALPDPVDASTAAGVSGQHASGRVQPRNAEEERLLEIWREVLGRRRIGVTDDFFALGGHSLLATRIAARVRAVFGVDIPLRTLFDHPTIEGVARWVRSAAGSRSPDEQVLIPRSTSGRGPLSFAQERLWFLQELSPTDTSFNLVAAVLVDGILDRERLREAVGRVEERHEVLRIRVRQQRGRPYQVVHPPGAFEWTTREVPASGDGSELDDALALAASRLQQPYDLAEDAPLRVMAVRLGSDRELIAVGMHHIVGDQASIEILFAELAEAYGTGSIRGSEDPPTSYLDFAAWQREKLRDDRFAGSLAYWMDRLRDAPTVDLPSDRPRPAVRSGAGAAVSSPMPVEVVERLDDLGVETRSTPFMLLYSAFLVLLHARTRADDFVTGVPVAHRRNESVEGAVGTFVNVLAHRNDLTGDPTFREIVERVREASLEAFVHQDVPFELLVRELDPPRDESRTPLFQVMFNLANTVSNTVHAPGLSLEPVRMPTVASQFDLTLAPEIHERRQDYQLVYSTDLFDSTTAEAMLQHYGAIVERALQDPDARLSELVRPTDEESALLLDEWNRTDRPVHEERDAVTSVRALVSTAADRVAVQDADGSWTYSELCDAMDRAAACLNAKGVEEGDRVAVAIGRGRALVAALLATWRVGAVYVPLDPTWPEERLRWMLEDCGARLLLVDGAPPSWRGSVPAVDPGDNAGGPDIGAAGGDSGIAAYDPDRPAYRIYTSGSTGTPKAVEVPHRAVSNFLAAMAKRPGLTADDRLLAVTTISFDISVLEIFGPLLVGGRVVIASDAEVTDGRALARRLEEAGITVMQATPSSWRLLLTAGWRGSTGLRILCGGEPLTRELADELLHAGAEVWNMYGPTETTVWSTIRRVEPGERISIGRPIDNTRVYVTDPEGRPVPIGVPGELRIGGRGVALGYAGRPELTAERFVDSPFVAGDRLYRTGDRVRFRRDGTLLHEGRFDHQVKVRGHRVEPGEIETRLRGHEAVKDAVVVARDDRLVAYVQYTPAASATTAELRAWTGAALPRYMIPSLFVPLDELPLTLNGKIDRARLPTPAARESAARSRAELEGETEQAIAEAWSELLGVEDIGADDNFFELGGHSLLAMEVTAILDERAGIRIEPRELFFKTLRQLGAGAVQR